MVVRAERALNTVTIAFKKGGVGRISDVRYLIVTYRDKNIPTVFCLSFESVVFAESEAESGQ